MRQFGAPSLESNNQRIKCLERSMTIGYDHGLESCFISFLLHSHGIYKTYGEQVIRRELLDRSKLLKVALERPQLARDGIVPEPRTSRILPVVFRFESLPG